MSSIALTCPSSHTTWILAEFLLRRGHSVRLLCRSYERITPLIELGAQVITGNLLAPATASSLFENSGTAYLVTPASSEPGDTLEIRVAHALAAAIQASDVEHVVYLSALGAGQPGDVPHLQAKAEVEQILLDTGRDVTILRPGVLMDNLWLARKAIDRGVLALPMHPDCRFPVITARDVASAALHAITHGPYGCRSFDLPGSGEVSPLEVVKLLASAWGRSITYRRHSREEFVTHLIALGLTPRRALLLTTILSDYDSYEIDCDRASWSAACKEMALVPTTPEEFTRHLAHAELVPASIAWAVAETSEDELVSSSLTRGTPAAWVPGENAW
jgi:uncharacterized protein YbjT (DUF2867 family)